MSESPLLAGLTALYLLLVLALGAWSVRRTRSERDFFLAGQRLGLWVVGITTMSAAFSGFVFLGGPGLMYRRGIASLFIVLPIGVTPILLAWVLAVRIRLLAQAEDVLTLPDVVRLRYGNGAAPLGAAATVLAGSVGYLAAQLLALGVLLSSLFGLDLVAGVAVGLVVIVAYSVAGGMVAGVWTDLAQGVIMLAAAIAVFSVGVGSGGGLSGLAGSIAESDSFGARFFEPFGSSGVIATTSLFLVFSVGTLGQPQMLHKLMMVRDVESLRGLPLVLGLSQGVCLMVWLGLGLAVPAAVARGDLAALAHPDQAAPVFLATLAPPAVGALALVGVMAAIMSTADSFLNLSAAAVARDLPLALGKRPRATLGRLRLVTSVIAVAAGALALAYGDLIALLGTFAFGLFGAGLAPALAIGLNWRRVSRRAAAASIWVGLVSTLALELVSRYVPTAMGSLLLPAGIAPAAMALLLSLATLLLLSWLEDRPQQLEPFVDRVLSA